MFKEECREKILLIFLGTKAGYIKNVHVDHPNRKICLTKGLCTHGVLWKQLLLIRPSVRTHWKYFLALKEISL